MENSQQDKELLSRLINEQVDSIENVSEGKIYLKFDRIYPTLEGIFLFSNNSTIHLPTLHSDDKGCYLSYKSNDILIVYKCTNEKCRYNWDPMRYGYNCPRCKSSGKPLL